MRQVLIFGGGIHRVIIATHEGMVKSHIIGPSRQRRAEEFYDAPSVRVSSNLSRFLRLRQAVADHIPQCWGRPAPGERIPAQN
jgi:hypothetical protein